MSVQTKLREDFKCQCEAHCEPILGEIPGDPRVIVETCGCIFRMSHLGKIMGGSFSHRMVDWFLKGRSYSNGYRCPNRDEKIADAFSVNDIILDQGRYMTLWNLANDRPNDNFAELTGNDNLKGRFSALSPEGLGEILADANINGKKEGQMAEKNALQGRVLASQHEQWGLFRKLSFTVRSIYHVSVAFFVGYGTIFLRFGRWISEQEQREMLLRDMGERLRPLFLEYYGFRYNPEDYPSRTIEARLWNWILRR